MKMEKIQVDSLRYYWKHFQLLYLLWPKFCPCPVHGKCQLVFISSLLNICDGFQASVLSVHLVGFGVPLKLNQSDVLWHLIDPIWFSYTYALNFNVNHKGMDVKIHPWWVLFRLPKRHGGVLISYFLSATWQLKLTMVSVQIICRYCKRAKAVFKELNQVPYVVELDQRGLFTTTLSISSYLWEEKIRISFVQNFVDLIK